MKTRGKTFIAFVDKSGRLDEAQLQQDLDKIKEFYQDKGYIDVEVQELRRERKKGPLIDHDRDQGRNSISRQQAHILGLQTDNRTEASRDNQDEGGQHLFAQSIARRR